MKQTIMSIYLKVIIFSIFLILSYFSFSQTNFQTGLELNTGSFADVVACGDVNNDGIDDIVTAISTGSVIEYKIMIYLQDSFGSLSIPIYYSYSQNPIGTSYIVHTITINDVNNDGLNDVIIGFHDTLGIFFQNNLGTLDPVQNIYSGQSVYGVKTGDLNNDGLSDIAVTHWNENFIRVFYQTILGFSDTTYIKPSSSNDEIDIGDLNNDGLDDVLVMSGQISGQLNGGIHLFMQNSLGYLNNYISYFPPGMIDNTLRGVAIGDLNNDGSNDIVATKGFDSNISKLLIWYQDTSTNTLQTPITTPTIATSTAIEVADFNCDGKLEIFTIHGGFNYLSVFHQDLTGSYTSYDNYSKSTFNSTHPKPQALCSGDIDNDGKKDIISVGIESAVDLNYNISISLNFTTSTISLSTCDSLISPSGNYIWTTSGSYLDTIPNSFGCDSIITVNLTINNSTSSISPTVCDSFISPSNNYTWTTSGTYLDTIPNAAGCDSIITVNLTVNNNSSSISLSACDSLISPSGNYIWTTSGTYLDTIPNSFGCDSIITVNLTVNNNSISTISLNACDSLISPSGNYIWTTSGTYLDTIPNTAGCDSIITVNLLNIYISSTSSISPTVCDSFISPSNNYIWTTSGSYLDTIPNSFGCDSIITVNLTINNSTSSISPTVCDSFISPSYNYTWTTSGTYLDTIPNAAGCDSIITVNLTVNNNSSSISLSACDSLISPSGNYIWTTSGTYLDTIPNTAGCDSIITVNLTINNNSISTISLNACDSIISPSGNYIWTTSGTYLDTIPNAAGCDSIITLNLTVNNNSISTISLNACDSLISPSGNYIWTTSGTYLDTIPNAAGCDSIITLNLTINPTPNVTINAFNPDTLCTNTSALILPIGSPAGGNYTGNGIVGGNFDPSSAGIGAHDIVYTYTDGNSCINSDTTTITVDVCIGIDNSNNDFGIIIYPNPSTGQFTIEKPSDFNKAVQIKLLDATSKLILGKIIPIGKQKVEMDILNYSDGIYYLHLIVDDEHFVKQILKN